MATAREAQYFGRNFIWFGAGFQITTSLDLAATYSLTEGSQRLVRYDPSGGSFVISLPAQPAPGSTFTFKEVAGSATAVTVDGNGNLIEGSSTYLLNAARRARTLRYSSVSDQWEVIAGVN